MQPRILLLAVALFAVVGLYPNAQALEYVELESAYEINASQIRVPRNGVGNVMVETCEDCKKLRFKLTPQSLAFVGRQQVTVSQFRNLAIANDAAAYVFYKPDTFEITRLVLDMPGLN